MNQNPYAVTMHCPFTNTKEDVFFYEVARPDGIWLSFNGCDHQWHPCEECEACHRNAYKKLTTNSN